MNPSQSTFHRIGCIVQKHFLGLLLVAYASAAAWPALGVMAKETTIARIVLRQDAVPVTLPMLLLAGLLFNAGLGADASQLSQVARKPFVAVSGLAMNLLVPVVFLVLAYPLLWLWHDPEEVQNLLLGLAVVAAMPIAGSSTAWSQNANGNVALSLGLVVLSTLLSPFTTPLVLRTFASMATGSHAAALGQIGGHGTGVFLLLCVVLPTLTGMLVRYFVGMRIGRLKPVLKMTNSLALLFLCYVNASAALPQMIADPDWDFLIVILVVVGALCVSAFAAGWLLAKLLRADDSQRKSLMFGLGMNNNGTGMVLACSALSAMPSAILPVLAYNFVQHLVAGGVDRALSMAHPLAPAA